jgi:hypothetical protein
MARPRTLWVGLALLLVAAGVSVLWWAYLENQAPAVVAYETDGGTILDGCNIFGCADTFDPTAWYAAAGLLVVSAAVPFTFALRRR